MPNCVKNGKKRGMWYMSIKLVKYHCKRLNKTITVTETYVEVSTVNYKKLVSVECSDSVNCIKSDCKMTGQSKPKLYIDANY